MDRIYIKIGSPFPAEKSNEHHSTHRTKTTTSASTPRVKETVPEDPLSDTKHASHPPSHGLSCSSSGALFYSTILDWRFDPPRPPSVLSMH